MESSHQNGASFFYKPKLPADEMKKALIYLMYFTIALTLDAKQVHIVFIAGNSIHRWGDHENLLMCNLYKDLLTKASNDIKAEVLDASKGSPVKLDGAAPDAVIIIGEGETNHPLKDNPSFLKELNRRKINVGVIHYALHFSDEKDYKFLDSTVGGHYEPFWSVNPTWTANFVLEKHPITNGVKPFSIKDEYYFNIRFSEMPGQRVIPIAKAAPPDKVRMYRFGAHTGNQYVRDNKGKLETLLWVAENADSTRGFGYAGGHSIWAFAQKDFRKLMLNAAAWLSGVEIPPEGFESPSISYDEIASKITKDERPDKEYYEEVWRTFVERNSAQK